MGQIGIEVMEELSLPYEPFPIRDAGMSQLQEIQLAVAPGTIECTTFAATQPDAVFRNLPASHPAPELRAPVLRGNRVQDKRDSGWRLRVYTEDRSVS